MDAMPTINLPPPSLPAMLGTRPGEVTVVLFSQADCVFCAEEREHYLRPLAASAPRGVVIAEVDLNGPQMLRDWQGRSVTQADFALGNRVRFAPTVMFFGAGGEQLAPPIIGLSRDFFGAYLDAGIAQSQKAAQRGARNTPSA